MHENERTNQNNLTEGAKTDTILNKISNFDQLGNQNININGEINKLNNNNYEQNTPYFEKEKLKKYSIMEKFTNKLTLKSEKDQDFRVFIINDDMDIVDPIEKKFSSSSSNKEITEKHFETKKIKNKLSVCKLLAHLICPSCFKNSKIIQLKKKVFYNLMKRNFEKTDMMYIQNQMRYLDILIHLTLDDRHIALLENVSKERFYFDCNKDKPSFVNKLSIRFDSQSKYSAYKELKKKAEENDLNEIDMKLIEILDEELISTMVNNKE